jgi:uncharacterized phiE125 gp8 family phage protein
MTLRPAVQLYQNRGNTVVTAPTVEPVTADELLAHLRTTSTDLPNAADYVKQSRSHIEAETNVAMVDQTCRLTIDHWPNGSEAWWDGVRQLPASELYSANALRSIALPRWPLASIVSVTVYDEDGTPAVVNVANTFDVDLYSTPGRLTLKRGATWPIAMRANNAIDIAYVAGYGDAAADVPLMYKQAIKQLAAYMYEHRGDNCSAGDAYQMSGAASILSVYKAARI